jgi:predicted TIM-barrel fold metal-dependent hydrolase
MPAALTAMPLTGTLQPGKADSEETPTVSAAEKKQLGGAPVSAVLDKWGLEYGLMIDKQASMAVGVTRDDEFGAILASAFNDRRLEQWSEMDRRLRYALVVSPGSVERAVAEIRRLGAHAGVAGILLPMNGVRWGRRQWYPIYEVATGYDLPIIGHGGAGDHMLMEGSPSYAVGLPDHYAEGYVDTCGIAAGQISSLVLHGVFERYPRLKVLFVEWGYTFIVPHMWRLDKMWRETRTGVPWLKRWPSEVVTAHIRFTTQPIDPPPVAEQTVELLEAHLSDVLLYASGRPEYDVQDQESLLGRLSSHTQQKIFHDNAKSTLRL